MIIMEILFGFVTIGIISLLGAMSPGPDFVLVTKNSILYSRKAGIYTSIGVGIGILVHVIYSLVGIGLIISQSILLFSILKYLGSVYLLYLGISLLRTKKESQDLVIEKQPDDFVKNLSYKKALHEGFLNSVLNPKTTIFFLSIFTQVINPNTHILVQFMYGLEVALIVFGWFALLSFVLSTNIVKTRFNNVQYYLSKMMGAILIALGIKVALSSQK